MLHMSEHADRSRHFTTVEKNLLDINEGVIIHGCNCRGVFNKGVAKQIAERYPEAKNLYLDRVRKHPDPDRLLGSVCVAVINPRLAIANAFTQDHYGCTQVYADIAHIHAAFVRICDIMMGDRYINSGRSMVLSFPKIGCGLGGLQWEDVSHTIDLVAQCYTGIVLQYCDYTP